MLVTQSVGDEIGLLKIEVGLGMKLNKLVPEPSAAPSLRLFSEPLYSNSLFFFLYTFDITLMKVTVTR